MIVILQHKIDPITESVNKYSWLLWIILWTSLAIGLGQDGLNYDTEYIITVPEILNLIVVILLWVALVMQILRQIIFTDAKEIRYMVGNWFLLGATFFFAFRFTWILLLKEYNNLMSPFMITGVALFTIGIFINSVLATTSRFTKNKNGK